MNELTLAIVGIDFANPDKSKSSRRMELLLCPPGEAMELRLEPKNPHDENAIGVWSARGIQVGYVTAERAPWIGRRMKAGEDVLAVFQGMDNIAGYVRVRFGGGGPTLPPAALDTSSGAPRGRAAQHDADDDAFFPDEDGPEWGA